MKHGALVRTRSMGWMVAAAMGCLLFVGANRSARAADAPARSARLSYVQGSVTVDQVDNTGSDPAQLNMPLAQGVRVTTGADGQAEIEFEDGSLMRLTPNSSLGLTDLTADGSGNFQTRLTLGYGLAYAELRAADKFAYSVDAGGAVVSPVSNATVRIEMDKPPAAISVLDGTVQVERDSSDGGEGYRTNVNSGETLTGDASDAGRYSLTKEIAKNSWDQWNDDRDKAASEEAANQTSVRDNYAGEAGYGWSDLDANGSWYDVPGEGEVWQPTVALDPAFDPYGYGSWVSYPGRGYVWASGYGWGWTPFRCGNWSYWDGFGWGWLPGSGCGFGGWGFGSGYGGGGGYVINVTRPPLNYRFRPIPVHSPGGVHPIRVGRPVVVNPVQMRPVRGPRTIAGRTVEPMRPVPNAGAVSGAHPAGGALRRDFPVDRSHRPMLGKTGPGKTVPEGTTPATTPNTNARPVVVRPAAPRGGIESRETPMRPEPSPTVQRPIRPQQEQRPVMPPQSAPRNIPSPQPRYTPPPQPRYSPPPQPRYSPPPSAPSPRPAPSAPAPSRPSSTTQK